MKFRELTIYMLFIIGSCGQSFAQYPNRVSIQTGVFHLFFDNTPIINSQKVSDFNQNPQNAFGGYLNDSWGLMYQRHIKGKSYLSIEFMSLFTQYFNGNLDKKKTSSLLFKKIKNININYSRKKTFWENLNFTYGVGIDYLWGQEQVFLVDFICSDKFGCSSIKKEYQRGDIGINIRTGVEYTPLKWLTLFTNIDFIGYYIMKPTEIEGIKTRKFLKDEYGLKNTPSRTDLSWRFGLGINFGK